MSCLGDVLARLSEKVGLRMAEFLFRCQIRCQEAALFRLVVVVWLAVGLVMV